ncbi:hypothetical protein LVT69_26500, partial [Klebsiella pneumoniae]|nr:hypothetical protein [Klebsiella pneumoniae]MDV2812454.1 hypothetical protein [Klebsiella pneumoniae]MDV2922570.1 hypothetical protein [Klebsiella pneumoniae]MDV2927745.1 hypothetical protein [Klebsiella pneumoniae]
RKRAYCLKIQPATGSFARNLIYSTKPMRTIRQGLNYVSLFSDVNDNKSLAINNFIVHKVLPKFTFDGDKQVGDYSKAELVSRVFLPRLESLLDNQVEIAAEFSCTKSIERLVKTAESNDGVVNYWA